MPLRQLLREFVAGFLVALVSVTFCVAYGLIAFEPFTAFGPGYAAFGVQAGLWGGVAAGLVTTLVGGTCARATAPIVAGALLLAELFYDLAVDPRLPPDPHARFLVAIAIGGLVVGLAGLFQVVFGALGLGTALKYLAYPVVAGLMAAVGLLVVRNQIPILLGWTGWDPQPVSWPTLLTGCVVILAIVFGPRWLASTPGQVIGLGVGVALGAALEWFGGGALARVGSLHASLPIWLDLPSALHYVGVHGVSFALEHVVAPALSIALFSSLSSLIASIAVDTVSSAVHDSNRELVGQGLGNVAAALVGGLPGGGAASLSTMNYRCGARTRVAGAVTASVLVGFIVYFEVVLSLVPKAVLAGIIVVGATRLIDPWVLRLGRAALASDRQADRATVLMNLLVLVAVAAVSLAFNLIAGIVVGLLASSADFIARAARVRFRLAYRGDRVHSKRARPAEDCEALSTLGRAIAVFELQGPLFFGSAERVVARLRRDAPDARYIVVGLNRVDEIDASGFRVLYQFLDRMRHEGRYVLVTHLTTRHALWPNLADMGIDPRDVGQQFFADTDAALEWAENRLLEAHRPERRPHAEVPLGEIDVLRDVPKEMLDWFASRLTREVHRPGDVIIREGDADRSLYLLAAGTVSVLAGPSGDGAVRHRVVSFSPGTVFGEIAFLDAGLRSASAVADDEVVCHVLTVETFELLRRERSDWAVTLLANLSLDLVQRLRTSSTEVRALQS